MSESSFIVLNNQWYPVSFADELRVGDVKQVKIYGQQYVLFRTSNGDVGMLEDRCPHRNAPLSAGFSDGETLRCAYHGWAFSTDGACKDIPCLAREYSEDRRAASPVITQEDDCLIWGWFGSEDPTHQPRRPESPEGNYSELTYSTSMPGPLPAVIENALDVPHTRYLHAGMFRDDSTNHEITLSVSLDANQVVAQYHGEPRPGGLVGRFLAPGGGVVEHWDRFIMPSTAEVEYRLSDKNHIIISTVCAPTSASETRLYAVVRYRTRMPDRLLKPLLLPMARKILSQDAEILELQEKTIAHFGAEQFSSTELDAIGPRALYLMRAANRGDEITPKEFSPVTIRV